MTVKKPGKPAAADKPRWPYFGKPQKVMVFAGFGMWIGVALPWFVLRELNITRFASPLAASWVLWAGLMAFAGAVARWRLLAVVSAVAGGGTAFVISFWQLLIIFQRCGFDVRMRCFPGPGVFAIVATSMVVLVQGYRVFMAARTG